MQWMGTMTTSGANLHRGRGSLVALWATQVALAAMFLTAGESRLVGVPAMVSLFDLIGIGPWLRYVTGDIEVISGIAPLVPLPAVFGALLLIATMVGAISTNVFVVHASPVIPLLLLLAAAAVARARRHQLRLS